MSKINIENYNLKTNKNINKRICLISDIHHDVNCRQKFYDKLLVKIKSTNPDYIVIAGDILDCGKVLEDVFNKNMIEEFIKSLGSIAKTIVTVGNHDLQYSFDYNNPNLDHLYWYKELTKYPNIYYIYNETLTFNNLDFIHYTPSGQWFRSRKKDAFYHEFNRHPIGIKKNNHYKVLISHSPVSLAKPHNYKRLPIFTDNINLILSGHMHNGGLPNFLEFFDFKNTGRGLISPSKKAFPLYCRGLQKIDKMDIIISRGIREFNHPKFFRIFNFLYDAEVTIIDLE